MTKAEYYTSPKCHGQMLCDVAAKQRGAMPPTFSYTCADCTDTGFAINGSPLHLGRVGAMVNGLTLKETRMTDVKKVIERIKTPVRIRYTDNILGSNSIVDADGKRVSLERILETLNHLSAVEAEAKRYREALEHYADENNWLSRIDGGINDLYDNGHYHGYDCAKAALAGKGTKDDK